MSDVTSDPAIAARIAGIVERVGGLERAAATAGVSRATIQKWRTAKARPPLIEVQKLAEAAGITVDWIATGLESPSAASIVIPRFAPDAAGKPVQQPFDADSLMVHRDFFTQHRLTSARSGSVRVMGDAMAPSLPEGALVVIDMRSTMVQDEGLYVIGQSGRAIVRRAAFAGEAMHLLATNPAFGTIDVSPEQALRLNVWGRVRAALVTL